MQVQEVKDGLQRARVVMDATHKGMEKRTMKNRKLDNRDLIEGLQAPKEKTSKTAQAAKVTTMLLTRVTVATRKQ